MRAFVRAADAIATTSKKTEKVRILSELFASLPLADAQLAAQFFTGKPFAHWEERVVGVAGATLANAIAEAANRPESSLSAVYRKHGDLGEVAGELFKGTHEDTDFPIKEVASLFADLATTRSAVQKVSLLQRALGRSSAGDAKYIVKILTGDLRIGLKESLVEEAISHAYSRSLEQVRRANLLLGDIGEALRLAAANHLDSAQVRLFHPVGLMLASPVDSAEELFARAQAPLFVEPKFDGIRAQVHKNGAGKVKIFSRTRDEVTEFPELYSDLTALPGECILDGEILAWRDDKPLPFTELQKRLGRKKIDLWMQYDLPVIFACFDILFRDGQLLLDTPLQQRKVSLRKLLREVNARVFLVPASLCQMAQEVETAFRAALASGHEGIVAKQTQSLYSPGRRGRAWLKWKIPYATLDVVVTAAEYGHGKRHHVLSDVTFAVRDGEKLLNVGKAYSGLTDAEIAANTNFFQNATIEDQGFRLIVEPTLVLEVAFNNIQRSDRHESGFALRFPRIVRIRTDKKASEIDTVARVEELFAKQGHPNPAKKAT